jgi:hypothetical protein
VAMPYPDFFYILGCVLIFIKKMGLKAALEGQGFRPIFLITLAVKISGAF